MLKIRVIHCLVFLAILLPAFASAESPGVKDYNISKGDTLWDISSKELSDPFLWPKIWKENPDIKNPDRVYPGQKIRIPLSVSEKATEEQAPPAEVKEESAPPVPVVKEEPAPPKIYPLVGKNLFMSSGYIADSVPSSIGQVSGSPYKGVLYGNNEIIDIKTKDPVKVGDKFYIMRAVEIARHPITDKKIGHIISFRGIAEVTKIEYGEPRAMITHMFADILYGDLLIPYYEMNPPIVQKPYRKPNIESMIVGTQDFRQLNTGMDIVYIDKGKNDGIETGDIFRTLAVGTIVVGRHSVPSGFIQIIHTMEKTATAVVLKSSEPVTRGQLATYVE